METRSDGTTRPGGAGRTIAIVVVVAVLLAVVAWALGLFNVDASGKLETPKVEMSGGEVPEIQVETADVDVGTKTETIEVPTVDIQPAGDDGKADK